MATKLVCNHNSDSQEKNTFLHVLLKQMLVMRIALQKPVACCREVHCSVAPHEAHNIVALFLGLSESGPILHGKRACLRVF
jgi:hypothetical protein